MGDCADIIIVLMFGFSCLICIPLTFGITYGLNWIFPSWIEQGQLFFVAIISGLITAMGNTMLMMSDIRG